MTEYPWHAFPSAHFGTIYRPIALVHLIGPRKQGFFEFLIDSGADITSIPFDAGRYLGFRLKSNELVYSMGGIGGNIGYVIRNVEIILARRHSEIRVAWTLSAKTPYILGQLDVFEQFRIELNRKDLKTVFVPC
jgi:hypothetical protein